MGFLERVLPGRRSPAIAPAPRHALAEPVAAVTAPPAPRPVPRPVPRTDITLLLGRNLMDPYTEEIFREYALRPVGGFYEAPELGVQLAVDAQGTVVAIQLYFQAGEGFEPYPGSIPGRGGTIGKRGSMWASLGRPDQSTDPHRDHQIGAADQWRFPTFLMHAQYAMDGDNLLRLTLRY